MANRAHNSGDAPVPRPTATRSAIAAESPQIDGLEIAQDLRFQHMTWRVQRLSWLGMVLVLLAALLGLFGSGPLSHTSAKLPGSRLRLDYERFGRQRSQTVLRFHLEPGSTHDGQTHVWLDRGYLNNVKVGEISPLPVRSEVGPERVHYLIKTTKPDQPTTVTFEITPQRFGLLSGQAGLDHGPPIHFQQWIYP